MLNYQEKTGIDDTYLGRIERNEINITLSTLEKVINGVEMNNAQFFKYRKRCFDFNSNYE